MDSNLLGRALDLFAVLDPTHLPSHFIQIFLIVAQDGPCTFAHIEDRLSLSNSAVSRTIQALGTISRKGTQGFGLVTVERDPAEGRRYLAVLTSRGHALYRQIEAL
jgi:DNA-binding MarR family transcriptional regulator